jgi:hypothetical protein
MKLKKLLGSYIKPHNMKTAMLSNSKSVKDKNRTLETLTTVAGCRLDRKVADLIEVSISFASSMVEC